MLEIVKASRKRIALAWYIDYIFISFLIGHISVYIYESKEAPFYVNLIALVVFEYLVTKFLPSPGLHFMTITASRMDIEDVGVGTRPGIVQVVDRNVFERENWFSILSGIVLILEGSKIALRWALWNPPYPFLGFETNSMSNAAVACAMGACLVVTGYSILKTKTEFLWIGVAALLVMGLSIILSWEQWDGLLEMALRSKREYLGMPVTPSEVDFLRKTNPELLIATTGIFLALISYCYIRFYRFSKTALNFAA